MKKSLLVSVFAALAMMVSVNSFAQEKATKEDYKEIAKQEKVLNKDLQKKAIKEARKEAKKLTKEGFKTPVGKLPLVCCLFKSNRGESVFCSFTGYECCQNRSGRTDPD